MTNGGRALRVGFGAPLSPGASVLRGASRPRARAVRGGPPLRAATTRGTGGRPSRWPRRRGSGRRPVGERACGHRSCGARAAPRSTSGLRGSAALVRLCLPSAHC